jgi:hypothetical protein
LMCRAPSASAASSRQGKRSTRLRSSSRRTTWDRRGEWRWCAGRGRSFRPP